MNMTHDARESTDQGSITVEAALSLSAVTLIFVVIFGGLITAARYIAAVDAAGAAARAYVMGQPYTPPQGELSITTNGAYATATVTISTGWGTVQAYSVFLQESRE